MSGVLEIEDHIDLLIKCMLIVQKIGVHIDIGTKYLCIKDCLFPLLYEVERQNFLPAPIVFDVWMGPLSATVCSLTLFLKVRNIGFFAVHLSDEHVLVV